MATGSLFIYLEHRMDSGGNRPFEGVKVRATWDSVQHFAVTNAAGFAEFPNITGPKTINVNIDPDNVMAGTWASNKTFTVAFNGTITHSRLFTRAAGRYYATGRITNASSGAFAGVSVAHGITGYGNVTTDSNGVFYVFNLATASTYTLTPSYSGVTFSPINRSFTVAASDLTGQDFAEDTTRYSISGYVYQADGVTGLSGAEVTVDTISAFTQADGYYQFDGYIDGTTHILNVTYGTTGFHVEGGATPPPINVTFAGADITQNWVADAAPPSTYSVSGRVTESGTGINGLGINLRGFANDGTYINTTTITQNIGGLDGSYEFINIPESHLPSAYGYTIEPYAPQGYSWAPASYNEVLVNGADVINKDFAVTADVTSNITGSCKVSVGGAGVQGVVVNATGPENFSTTTDINGSFSFIGIPAGTYTLSAEPMNGYTGWDPAPGSSTVVTIPPVGVCHFIAVQAVSILLFGYCKLNGVGLNGVDIDIRDAISGDTITHVTSGMNGIPGYWEYQATNESYWIIPTLAGYTFNPLEATYNLSNNPGGAYQAADFNATAVAAYYNASGRITCGGTGLSNVTVTVTGKPPVLTDVNGDWEVVGLADGGSYTAIPSLTGYTFSPGYLAFTISGADETGLDFSATAPGTTYSISGTIQTAGGAGLTGVTVTAGFHSAITGVGGTYTIPGVPAGTYTVTPSLSGYTFSPATISVTVGPNATGINFTASGAPPSTVFTLSGQILIGGTALAGATVTAGIYGATTDAMGNFSILNVPPGTYTLSPFKAMYSFTPATRVVTVTTANVSGLDFSASLTNPIFPILPYIFHNIQGSLKESVDADHVMDDLYALLALSTSIQNAQIHAQAAIEPTKVASSLSPPTSSLFSDFASLVARLVTLEGNLAVSESYSAWNVLLPVDFGLEVLASGDSSSGGYLTVVAGKQIAIQGHLFTTSSQRLPASGNLTPNSAYALRASVAADGTLQLTLSPIAGEARGPSDPESSAIKILEFGAVTGAGEFLLPAPAGTPMLGALCTVLDGTLIGEEFYCTYHDPNAGGKVFLADALTAAPTAGQKVGVWLDHPDYEDAEGTLAGRSSPASAFVGLVYCGAAGSAPQFRKQANLGGFPQNNVIKLPWTDRLDGGSEQVVVLPAIQRPILTVKGRAILYDALVGAEPTNVVHQDLPSHAVMVDSTHIKGVNVRINPDRLTVRIGDSHLGIVLNGAPDYALVKSACFKLYVELEP